MYNTSMNNTTLATRYYVTRDPESEFPELNGHQGQIISDDSHDDAHYTVCVWGNGAPLEQALNEATSVVRFTEIGSVVADLNEIRDSITDSQYLAWMASNQSHDGSPQRSLAAMARELCEEYVMNTIETAKGVVDITATVIADQKVEVA
jgi:hypothetical protein